MLGFIKYLGYSAYNLVEHIYRGIVSIVYQTSAGDFVYTTDTSDNMVLVNSGDTSSVNNGLLHSGRAIELGALNDVTVGDAAKWTTYFDFATATHVKTFGVQVLNTKTINSILVSANEPSSETLSIFDANPNLVGKLAKSVTGTIPEVDLTLVASDSYYMCSEKSGAYLVDSRAGYGADKIANGTFDTDTVWVKNGVTIVDGVGRFVATAANTGFTQTPSIPLVSGKIYIAEVEVKNYTSGYVRFRFPFISVAMNENRTYSFIFRYDGVNGTIYLQGNDVSNTLDIDNASLREATATEIANYAETIRTNADLQQKGIQTTAFVTDGAGTPLSYTSNILNWDANSYTDTQWNPSLESSFWLEEVIDGVVYQHDYDGVNLTTYTDNVAGAPTAHSPENASYLLGKGVYPKVTADPYISYQSKTFQVYIGSTYANYDQSSRYAILAAL